MQNVFIHVGRSVIMNIQNDYDIKYNVAMQRKGPIFNKPKNPKWQKIKNNIKQKFIDFIPEKTFSEDGNRLEKYDRFDGWLSRPDVNRLIMGATAITTQPVIDYYNHRVDNETRTVSRNRTIAKIVAGTTVGILVRGFCYRIVDKMTKTQGTKKINQALLPKNWIEKFKNNPKFLSNYKSTLSTGLALAIMVFTNFLIDAPLTVYFTNKLNAKSAKKMKRKEVTNG